MQSPASRKSVPPDNNFRGKRSESHASYLFIVDSAPRFPTSLRLQDAGLLPGPFAPTIAPSTQLLPETSLAGSASIPQVHPGGVAPPSLPKIDGAQRHHPVRSPIPPATGPASATSDVWMAISKKFGNSQRPGAGAS